jgi:hypothetical protein
LGVYKLNELFDDIDLGLGQDAMPEIEDMASACSGLQDLSSPSFDRRPVSQQRDRVEVPLQGFR